MVEINITSQQADNYLRHHLHLDRTSIPVILPRKTKLRETGDTNSQRAESKLTDTLNIGQTGHKTNIEQASEQAAFTRQLRGE